MSKVVAVIEDDIDDLEFICEALLSTEKEFHIKKFFTGNDFFTYIQSSNDIPELILTDIKMPIVSGFDVIKYVKANEKTQKVPVIVLSTSSNIEDQKQAQELGAAAYYVKPYSLREYNDIASKIIHNLNSTLMTFSLNLVSRMKTSLQNTYITPTISLFT